MQKPAFILLLCLYCFACNPADTSSSQKEFLDLPFRPNILWLVAEDMRPTIPSFGDSTIITPNLSRLAAEGLRFTHVFSPSGVCAPSRAAIATGMYPSGIGANHMRTGPWYAPAAREMIKDPGRRERVMRYRPPEIEPYEAVPPTFVKMHSEYLRAAGYYCSNRSKEDYQFVRTITAWDESSNQAHFNKREAGQNFFSIFNFGVTHESQIWSRANDSLWIDEKLDIPVPPYLPDNEVGKKDVRRMYSNIKIMDQQLGEILQELEAAGQLDSTIVFWYTDHGGPLPRQKRLLYDSGMHLPLIVRFPNAWKAGEIDDRLISFVDFLPTILSLAGIEPPTEIDGRAFLGKYRDDSRRQYIYGAADRFDERYDMIRAVRDKKFKYLRNYNTDQPYYLPVAYREQMAVMQELLRLNESGELTAEQAQWFRQTKEEEELFDTESDPHELYNLAKDPAYADKLQELREACDRWMKAIDDKGLLPEKELRAQFLPEGKQPICNKPEIKLNGNTAEISCTTPGSSIGYQLLGQADSLANSWSVYTGPFEVPEGAKVVAQTDRIGYLPSEVVEME